MSAVAAAEIKQPSYADIEAAWKRVNGSPKKEDGTNPSIAEMIVAYILAPNPEKKEEEELKKLREAHKNIMNVINKHGIKKLNEILEKNRKEDGSVYNLYGITIEQSAINSANTIIKDCYKKSLEQKIKSLTDKNQNALEKYGLLDAEKLARYSDTTKKRSGDKDAAIKYLEKKDLDGVLKKLGFEDDRMEMMAQNIAADAIKNAMRNMAAKKREAKERQPADITPRPADTKGNVQHDNIKQVDTGDGYGKLPVCVELNYLTKMPPLNSIPLANIPGAVAGGQTGATAATGDAAAGGAAGAGATAASGGDERSVSANNVAANGLSHKVVSPASKADLRPANRTASAGAGA